MKSNFSVREINAVSKLIAKTANFLTMRINKCGNIDLDLRFCHAEGYAHFVLYKRENGYKIRRRVYDDNPFGTGTYLNNNRPFATIKEAMDYFERYISKRKDSLIANQTYFV